MNLFQLAHIEAPAPTDPATTAIILVSLVAVAALLGAALLISKYPKPRKDEK